MALSRIGANRHFVSGADLAMHRGRYIGMVGDLSVPPHDVLNAALATVAGAGPHTRVGLVPSARSRLWRCDTAPLTVRRVPADVSVNGMRAVLEYVRRRPGPRDPLEVHVSDRHIAVDTDHGLGDGRLFVDLTASLLALARGDAVRWVDEPDTRLALPRALLHTFGRSPARLLSAWSAVHELRATKIHDEPAPDETVSWTPSLAVEVVHLSAELEAEVNHWRRANAPSAASGASWMYAVFRALQRAGLRVAGHVRVAVDARRYLPAGRSVNGNFIAGIEIALRDGDSVNEAGRRVRELTDTALPLVIMGVVSAVTTIRRSPVDPVGPSEVPSGVPAHLMYSDLGRLDILHGGPWRAEGPHSLAGLLDPSGPEGVTVLNSSIHGRRCISITFHENVFDRGLVRAAARLLETDPVALMKNV